MKRIILHWTAGKYLPNQCDIEHYHYLISGDGALFSGEFLPEDNEVCADGCYAKHTGGCNTGSVGVALCAMYGFKGRNAVGKFPITQIQLERAFQLCAELLMKYSIPLTEDTLFTHYEYGLKNPSSSAASKIDITFLPPYPFVGKDEVGSFIRSKVRWYLERI